jgi:hypothetical protein
VYNVSSRNQIREDSDISSTRRDGGPIQLGRRSGKTRKDFAENPLGVRIRAGRRVDGNNTRAIPLICVIGSIMSQDGLADIAWELN